MKKNQRIVAGIVAIVVGVGIVVAAALVGKQNNDSRVVGIPDAKLCPISETDGAMTVNYSGVADETALATLQNLCDVATESSDYGDLVVGIGGQHAPDTHFWAFYVNDKMAEVGAGTYKAKDGDKIKWVLTKIDENY